MGSPRPAEEQKGLGGNLLHPSALALWEKRNLGQIPAHLTANLGKHALFSGSPKLTASFLSLLGDVTWVLFWDNKVHLSFYPQPTCPHRQQPRLHAKQPAFILVRGTFGNKHWPAWLDVSFFFSVWSEEGGTREPPSLAGGLSQLPPHTISQLGCISAVWTRARGRVWMARHLIGIYHPPAAGWVGDKARGRGLWVFNAHCHNPTVCPKEPLPNIKGQGQK